MNGLKFGVLGLGDSGYAQFNYAAKRLNRRLANLGGREILPIGLADDQHDLGPDFVIDPWVTEFWKKALEIAPLPPGVEPVSSDALPPPRYLVLYDLELDKEENGVGHNGEGYGPQNPYYSSLISNDRVTHKDHFQDTRLIELSITEQDSSLAYSPGDVCLVQPRNSASNVDKFVKLFSHLDFEKKFKLAKNDDNIDLPPRSVLSNPGCTSLRECTSRLFDLQAIPGRYFFELLAKFTPNELVRRDCLCY